MRIKNISKTYKIKGGDDVAALKNISFDLPERGMVFILGRSGSGKSTLLNVLSGLDSFDSGDVEFEGETFKNFSSSKAERYRNSCCGFIFQEYDLIPELNVRSNIELAIQLKGDKDKSEVENILKKVGLEGYGERKVTALSGGQKQRVAIARAIIKQPKIIFADEPTGALDEQTSREILQLLKELSAERLVVVVSHDREFASQFGDRIIEIADGEIVSDSDSKFEARDAASGNWQKAKMPASVALKIGCSSFKYHPVRLAITLILAIMAFAMTGLALSAGLTGYDDIIYNAMNSSGLYDSSLFVNANHATLFTEEQRQELDEELGCATLAVIAIESEESNSEYIYFSVFPGEATFATEDDIEEFGFGIEGQLPQSVGEIALTAFTAEIFEECGLISGDTLTYAFREYTITGIIDTHLSSEYSVLKEVTTDWSTSLTTQFYYDIMYSSHNVLFLSEQEFEELKADAVTSYGGQYYRIIVPTNNVNLKQYISSDERYKLENYITARINVLRPQTDTIKNVSGVLGGIFAFFSVAVMLNLMSQSFADKTKSMGVLKAFGANNAGLVKIFACQCIMIGLAVLAVVTAILPALCTAASRYLLNYYALEGISVFAFSFAVEGILIAMIAAFVIVGCILPLIKISRMQPADILREQ